MDNSAFAPFAKSGMVPSVAGFMVSRRC